MSITDAYALGDSPVQKPAGIAPSTLSSSLVNNWLEVKMWDDQGFPEFELSQVPASLGEVTASLQPDSTASMSSWASSHCGQRKGLECRHSILMVSG